MSRDGGGPPLLAGLPMYDLPELRPAHDDWWRGLARHLRAEGLSGLPEELDRKLPAGELWRSGGLVLSQCCGYDLRMGESPRPSLVATPHYDVEGARGPGYCSLVVVRAGEGLQEFGALRGKRAAVNMAGSHSGHTALRYLVAREGGEAGFFSQILESGGHRRSVHAVRQGLADVATVDCVTFGLLSRVAPGEVEGLHILARSPLVPGLPYVTAPGATEVEIAAIGRALQAAAGDPSLVGARDAFALTGFSALSAADYDPLVEMAHFAEAAGVEPLL